MSLESIESFVEAAERGSLTGAARFLGVPKSTVSRRIARLEEDLGAVLVQRSARAFRLTPVGEALLQRSLPAIRDLQEARRTVLDAAGSVSGELRITLPVDIGNSPQLVGLFVAFREAHPGVRLFCDLTDRVVDLQAEGFDFAFRAHRGQLADRAGLKSRRVFHLSAGLYAATAYLARRGTPTHPRQLIDHDTVGFERPGLRDAWLLRGPEGDVEVPVRPVIVSSGLALVPVAVEAGAGIGLIGQPFAGRLQGVERVLPEWEFPGAELSLLWPANRIESPKARAFLDFLADHSGCVGG